MWSIKLTVTDKISIEISEGKCDPLSIISDDEQQMHCNFKSKNDAIKFIQSNLRKLKEKPSHFGRERGNKGGRPKKLDEDQYRLVLKLYKQKKLSINNICEMFCISKPTLYKYIKREHNA